MVNHDHDESMTSELFADRAGQPGSDGADRGQHGLGTVDRADRFDGEQVVDRLTPQMQEYLARQEIFFLATSDRWGECDNSFRTGPSGFVRVLGDKLLVYPEYHSSGVLASLSHIRDNPHIGILMMIDYLDGKNRNGCSGRAGLHINGRARVVSDDLMRVLHPELSMDPPGPRPPSWVEVDVDMAYIQPSQHIPQPAEVPIDEPGPAEQPVGAVPGNGDRIRRSGRHAATADNQAGRQVGGLPSGGEQRAGSAVARLALTAASDAGDRKPFSVPAPADPQAWRRAAEEVLAEARQRALTGRTGTGSGSGTGTGTAPGRRVGGEGGVGFRGWFG